MTMQTILLAAGKPGQQYFAASRNNQDQELEAAEKSRPEGGSIARTKAAPEPRKFTTRNIDIDPVTRSVVYQTLSAADGNIVAQYPSEAALNLRAYLAAARSEGESSAAIVRTA